MSENNFTKIFIENSIFPYYIAVQEQGRLFICSSSRQRRQPATIVFFLPATKSKGFQVLYSSFFVYYMRYLPTSINHNIFLKKKLYSQITQRITLPDACLLFDITLLQQRKYELGFYKHLM